MSQLGLSWCLNPWRHHRHSRRPQWFSTAYAASCTRYTESIAIMTLQLDQWVAICSMEPEGQADYACGSWQLANKTLECTPTQWPMPYQSMGALPPHADTLNIPPLQSACMHHIWEPGGARGEVVLMLSADLWAGLEGSIQASSALCRVIQCKQVLQDAHLRRLLPRK